MVPNPADRSKTITTVSMTRNYILALTILATVSVFAFLLLFRIISTQETSALTINVSGRQRMLSQRIAMLSVRLADADNKRERARLRQMLKEAIEEMDSAHRRLSEGDRKSGISVPSENVKKLFEGPPNDLDKKVTLFLTNAKKLTRPGADQVEEDNPALRFIVGAASHDILVSLDRVVHEYERESEAAIGGLEKLVMLLLGVFLIILVAEAFLIFRPMVAKIGQQTAQLQESYRRSRGIADTLQQSLMPKESPGIPTLHFASFFRSATTEAMVGGDFFDFFQTADDHWTIVIGDVAGHGIDAAAETARVKFLARDRASDSKTPEEIVSELNMALIDQGVERFTAITYMRYDESRSVLTIVGGGNPYPYLSPADEFVEASGTPVSISPDAKYEAVEVELKPGDTLFVYTDGLVEARLRGALFGYKGLRKSVTANAGRPLEAIVKSVVDSAQDFAGGNLADDILVLALRRE